MAERTPIQASPPDFSRAIDAVAQRRDGAAFGELFDYFAPRVKTYLIRGGASPALAEDLAQETLLTVWRRAESFDPARATASTWIFTIARNLRIDRLRKEWRVVATEHEDIDVIDDGEAPDDAVSAGERADQVRAALAQLSSEQNKVIALAFFEDKPHAEIARTLNIPLGTVKSRLRLAMKRLRDVLGEY